MLWILTASALALAGACVAALGALVLTGLLELPAFASLGELVHLLRTPSDYCVLPRPPRPPECSPSAH
ncbi:hypothetical protein ACW4TU_09245 [Streptomyces sp. QTS52]